MAKITMKLARNFIFMVALGATQMLHAESPRVVTIDATPFESASLREGVLVLKLKNAWLVDGSIEVKAGAEVRVAADCQVRLVERHIQVLVRFQPDRGALIDTTFDARSFGGTIERKSEILAVK